MELELIREQDPLKQGLKQLKLGMPVTITIREQDPLKQGLKPFQNPVIRSFLLIREQDPLKQGLKHIIPCTIEC